MKQLILASLALTTLGVWSCKKEETKPEATTTINIVKPVMHEVYTAGDDIPLEATVANQAGLHGWQVLVLNHHQDTIVTIEKHSHAAEMTINENIPSVMWMSSGEDSAHFRIVVSAQVDHEGTHESKEVSVTLKKP